MTTSEFGKDVATSDTAAPEEGLVVSRLLTDDFFTLLLGPYSLLYDTIGARLPKEKRCLESRLASSFPNVQPNIV